MGVLIFPLISNESRVWTVAGLTSKREFYKLYRVVFVLTVLTNTINSIERIQVR